MDPTLYIRAIAALAVVLGLIALVYLFAKRMGWSAHGNVRSSRRLQVVETLFLDQKRRLLLVACDDNEHLVLLGPQSETVLAPRQQLTALPALLADRFRDDLGGRDTPIKSEPSNTDKPQSGAETSASRTTAREESEPKPSRLKPPPPTMNSIGPDGRLRREPTLGPLPRPKGPSNK